MFQYVFVSAQTAYGCCPDGRGVPHTSRASGKLFTKKILQPSTTSYTSVSQKVLKGIAARFFICWLSPIVNKVALETGDVYATHLRSNRIVLLLWKNCLQQCSMEQLIGLRHRANTVNAVANIYTMIADNSKYPPLSARVSLVQQYLAFREGYNCCLLSLPTVA